MPARAALPLLLALAACGFPPKVLERRNGFGGRPMKEPPGVSEVPVRGFRVGVTQRGDGDKDRELEGELLAVDRKFIWVMVEEEVERVPLPDVAGVQLELYPSRAGWIGAWSGVGAASSASHGWFALATGPLWLLAGTTSTITAAWANDIEVPLDRLHRLAQFARYPAGMPPPWGPARAPRPSPPTPPPASQPTTLPASRPSARPASQPTPGPDEPGIQTDEPGMLR